MASNAAIAEGIQHKIDQIVEDFPQFVKRLLVFMSPIGIYRIFLDEEPAIRLLRPFVYNDRSILTPPIRNEPVSNRMVNIKQDELRILSEELVMLFSRIEKVLNWATLLDICSGRGRIVILPVEHHFYLSIFDIYIDHLAAARGHDLRESIRQQLNSSPSSDGSSSR